MIVLITGSSASGKTTIGDIFAKDFGFHHIDGDQVINELSLKSEDWNTIHHDLIKRALDHHAHGNVVISHVVFSDKFPIYQQRFNTHKINFFKVVLKPNKNILLDRNNTRNCHPKPTPLNIINFFHDEFSSYNNNSSTLVINNSTHNSTLTVQTIKKWLNI